MKLWFIRSAMAMMEWFLRLLVLNRDLPPDVRVTRDLAYGPAPQHRLDLYQPPGPGPHPVVLYVHGGGWVTGDKSNFAWICQNLAHHGHLVYSVNYRHAPEAPFPEAVRDLASALEWIGGRADGEGGDLARLFVVADSAGAHLSSWLVAASRSEALRERVGLQPSPMVARVRRLVLLYGIYDLPQALRMDHPVIVSSTRWLLGREDPDWAELASPALQLSSAMPPCLVCAGEKDPLFQQSRSLLRALEQRGVPHEALLFSAEQHPEAGHSFINFGRRACSRITLERTLAFLAE
jgi:acetyl esterase